MKSEGEQIKAMRKKHNIQKRYLNIDKWLIVMICFITIWNIYYVWDNFVLIVKRSWTFIWVSFELYKYHVVIKIVNYTLLGYWNEFVEYIMLLLIETNKINKNEDIFVFDDKPIIENKCIFLDCVKLF